MKPNTYSKQSIQPTNTAICILLVASKLTLGTQVPKTEVLTLVLGLGHWLRLTTKPIVVGFIII